MLFLFPRKVSNSQVFTHFLRTKISVLFRECCKIDDALSHELHDVGEVKR